MLIDPSVEDIDFGPIPPMEPPAEAAPDPTRWRCGRPLCRHGERWWMSVWGVVNCLHCCPPASRALVAAEGDLSNAPEVEANRSNQAVGEWPLVESLMLTTKTSTKRRRK